MCPGNERLPSWVAVLVSVVLLCVVNPAAGQLNLGPEEIVQAAGADLQVPEYSVPSFTYWDDDDLKDLVVGEKTDPYTGKVRVYLNVGTPSAPAFSTSFYVQSNGADLNVGMECGCMGCMGCFPRVVYWDADDRKDLLVGHTDGFIILFLNVGTDAAPTFDGGTYLQVGEPGSKTDIDVGGRPTPSVADWNNDGKKDLISGELNGKVRVYLNEGTDTEPDFRSVVYAQEDGATLYVAGYRCSPVVLDLDNDGKKDILAGNTYGHLLFYPNVGTDAAPSFSGYEHVLADGVTIDLADAARSRPSVCDWTGDGLLDVLIGAADGKVHLYQGFVADPDAPRLVSAVSRATHGDAGDFDIALPVAVSETRGVECREGGVTTIILTFSEDVQAIDGLLDDTEINLSVGTLASAWIVGSQMTIELSDVPEQSCLAITLAGIADLDSTPLSGDRDVHVWVLMGDTNADGNTNLIDMAQVKSMNGQPVDTGTARFDLNLDGNINLIDMALAKSLNGRWAFCP